MAPAAAKLAIIWIHGLGDRGSSWVDLQKEMRLPLEAKWKFPDAPTVPVTCNQGHASTSWFDIETIPVTETAKDYPSDIEASVKVIHGLIADYEKQGYQPNEIFVGGFSQGGALSVQSVLRYPRTLGGAICMSGWLMMRGDIDKWATKEGIKAPLFWGHGSDDRTVVFENQEHGVNALKKIGCSVTSAVYDGVGHSLSAASIGHFQRFFSEAAKGPVESKEL